MKVINLEDIRHGVRVANLSIGFAKLLRLPKKEIENLYISGLFHDLGKAYIDQDILNKEGKLTSCERKDIQAHSSHSYYEILYLNYSEDIANNILYHHENWDGSGYPTGLSGNDIPIGSRILKLTDVFDALTSDRPYRKKLSFEKALCIMEREKAHYDPNLLAMFFKFISFCKDDNKGKGNKVTMYTVNNGLV